jgi:hypothetical protein
MYSQNHRTRQGRRRALRSHQGIRIQHCKEVSFCVFPEKELRGFSPNIHIHVPVSDFLKYSQDQSTYKGGGDTLACG